VTGLFIYITWLMVAIPIAGGDLNIKKTLPNNFFSHFAKNRTYRTSFLVVKLCVVPDFTVM